MADAARPGAASGLLGCGSYEVLVAAQGGLTAIAALPFSSVAWSRVSDDTSDATVTISGGGAVAQCCELLSTVEPWRHELVVMRDGVLVWCGPIRRMAFPAGSATVTARDLSSWFDRRRLGTHVHAGVDVATIFRMYADDALAQDPRPNITLTGSPVGVTATRSVLAAERKIAGAEMRELARTGLDYTTIGREVMYGAPSSTLVVVLHDDHFANPPDVEVDGDRMANDWSVLGPQGQDGPSVVGTATDPASQAAYGLLALTAQEDRVLDTASGDSNAAGRLALTKRPLAIVTGGVLDQDAPVTIQQLVPGRLVEVNLAAACWPTSGTYRLQSVNVDATPAGEAVSVTLGPVGEETE